MTNNSDSYAKARLILGRRVDTGTQQGMLHNHRRATCAQASRAIIL